MSAKHDNADLDVDLFDFPVIEMTLEGVKEVKPEDVAAAVAAAVAAPAAEAPTAAPAAAASTGAAAPAEDVAAVAKAAALVETIEKAAPELLVPAAAPSAPQASWNQKAVLALVGVVLLVNAGIGLLAWRTSNNVGSGVATMREELALNADRLAKQNERIAELSRQRDAAVAAAANGAGEPLPALEAFDVAALRLARQEIDLGRNAEARLRLNRLLARIDAVEADRRADVEARAGYLLAQSLQSQADLKRSEAR